MSMECRHNKDRGSFSRDNYLARRVSPVKCEKRENTIQELCQRREPCLILELLNWRQNVQRNELLSFDWGIIHKKYVKDKNNVFGLFLDNNTGIILAYPAQSTGQAGPTLETYIQRYGVPKILLTDNASEFTSGEFKDLCLKKEIKQTHSPPYDPNRKPTEHYMEIVTSTMRSLLFISGLNPDQYWEHALTQAVNIQIRTALPGRCTPYEYTHGRRPNVGNLRIFGCEALAFIEKDKRKKLNPKV